MMESLWAELAPTPGRWRRSVFIGLGTMTALVVAWTIQMPSFAAPVVALFGLLPSNVCTWRKLPVRLALTTVGAVLSITVAGVLVQLPWLLLPVFFARSEEHTSELQSHSDLVCRLLLEKKKLP